MEFKSEIYQVHKSSKIPNIIKMIVNLKNLLIKLKISIPYTPISNGK